MKPLRKNSSSFDELIQLGEPIFDGLGRLIQRKGLQWKHNSVSAGTVSNLNWGLCRPVPSDVAHAFVAWMKFNVGTKSTDHSRDCFRELALLSRHFSSADYRNMRALLFKLLADYRQSGAEWRFHYIRDWYRWCFDQQLPGFDDSELLYDLVSLRVSGNRKGEAVLSEDSEEGPLDDIEEIALRAALHRDETSLLERTLTWAFLALGCNPKNLVHLWESDFKEVAHGGHTFYNLDVPRIKKGVGPRTILKTRKLDAFLATLLRRLIERNRALNIPPKFSRPMFARSTPRPDCIGTAIEEYAYHFTSRDLAAMLDNYVAKLGVISHRTGKLLRVTPRRLRYTFATRKVQEGCSMEALADLLDHTDLQNVLVYYAGTAMTQRLDEAMAVSVGPLVNRFMGRVVATETDAFNGGGRIKAEPMGRIKDIGTCGSTSLCTLFPPFSCYLCPLFQPWRDAPHREVLEDLVRQRDSRVETTGRENDRMAKQYDEIILAVGQVVALCEGQT